MTDFTHLDAIQLRLSHERGYLANAKSEREREMRRVWVAGIEKELEAEYRFLGIEPVALADISDDDLLAELMG